MAGTFGAEQRETLEKVLEAVYLMHNGDRDQVDRWLRQPNADIGGETPIDLIRNDRMDVLVDLLRTMVAKMEDGT